MVDIRWSKSSLEDLESISFYISQDSTEKAMELVKGIFDKVNQLKDFPYMGRKFPDKDVDRIRELIYKNYRIIYEVKEEFVEILVISHGSRIIRL